MTTTLTNESKNALSLANESKGHIDLTLDDVDATIDEMDGTIDVPHLEFIEESKNALSLTNESKN